MKHYRIAVAVGLAALALSAPAQAQRFTGSQAGSSSVTGGACPAGQAVNGTDTNAAPTGCFTPSAVATPAHPGYSPNGFYMPIGAVNESTNNAVPTTSTMVCSFGGIGGTAAVKLLALYIRLVTAGTTTFQAAVYQNDMTTFGVSRPGARVGVSGQIANTATGASPAASLTGGPFSVAPGFYWWCLEQGDTTAKHQAKVGSSADFQMVQTAGSSTAAISLGVTNQMSGVSTVVSGYGTFPTTFVGATSTTWAEIAGTSPAFRFTVSQ